LSNISAPDHELTATARRPSVLIFARESIADNHQEGDGVQRPSVAGGTVGKRRGDRFADTP
jgi:hypothetical protein